MLLLDELVGTAIPDLDGSRAVLTLRDRPFEVRVLERVVFDVNRKVTLAAAERNALRHCPAGQRTASLEPEVVVKPPRGVPLNHETRLFLSSLRVPERLRSPVRLPPAAILVEAHLWIVA
jgi:hypothetical protein